MNPAANKSAVQNKEALLISYNIRLRDDIKAMQDNFEDIVRLCKSDGDTQLHKMTLCELDFYEMQIRAGNMVRAAESLLTLISDIKQYLILNDFPSVNEAIMQNSKFFRNKQVECDQKLMTLRDDMATDLFDLEEEYYTSVYK